MSLQRLSLNVFQRERSCCSASMGLRGWLFFLVFPLGTTWSFQTSFHPFIACPSLTSHRFDGHSIVMITMTFYVRSDDVYELSTSNQPKHSQLSCKRAYQTKERGWVFIIISGHFIRIMGHFINISGQKGFCQGKLSQFRDSLSQFRDTLSTFWDGLYDENYRNQRKPSKKLTWSRNEKENSSLKRQIKRWN